MVYKATVKINQADLNEINHYLQIEPSTKEEALLEDDSISAEIPFSDGKIMEIFCKGVRYIRNKSNVAYTEAILKQKEKILYCTMPNDSFEGIWQIKYKGNTYIANVLANN